ncbi:MAG: hypothetical protein AAF321_08140, partial [Pseudomonadota bacterium]
MPAFALRQTLSSQALAFARRAALLALALLAASLPLPALAQDGAVPPGGGEIDLPARYTFAAPRFAVDLLVDADGGLTIQVEGGGSPCTSEARLWHTLCERAAKIGPQQVQGSVDWNAAAQEYRGTVEDGRGPGVYEVILRREGGQRLAVSAPKLADEMVQDSTVR